MTTVRQKMLRTEDFPPEQRSWLEPLLRYCNDLNTDTSSILNGGLSIGKNANAFVRTVTLQTKDDSIALPPLSSFTNYGSGFQTVYYCYRTGIVRVGGLIQAPAGGSGAGTSIAQIPSTLAPAGQIGFNAWSASGARRLDITTAGLIICSASCAASEFIFLDGISYKINAPSITNPVFPIAIRNQLKGGARPSGVVIIQAVDVTVASSPAPISIGGAPAWAMKGNDISIVDVMGLAALRKYQLTFLVLG